MSMKMVMSGFVQMVAISGEDNTEIYSTLTIITSHVPHSYLSYMYSRCSDGDVLSTKMACPPTPRECDT